MNDVEIKVSDNVLRYSVIGREKGNPLLRTVKEVAPMYEGGELLVWFEEGGGSHHPRACKKATNAQ